MPEKIEEILKQIHVLFSKSDMYQGSPDRIILNKREMFELLEQLNYAVVEVMEQYEATEQSRKNAQFKLEADKQAFIKKAHEEAQDVYAAVRIYADDALIELSNIVTDAKKEIRERCDRLDEEINARLDMIQYTRGELKFDLEAMANSDKYLSIIEEYNEKKKREKEELDKQKEAAAAEEETEAKPIRKVEPGVVEHIESEEKINIPSKYDIVVNARPDNIFERSLDRGGKGRKKNKKAREERPEEETAASLRSEDLDAEYYRWQEEQQEETAPESSKSEKKHSFFERLKEKK